MDQFWYKYAYMEEMLGNVAGARQIFDRLSQQELVCLDALLTRHGRWMQWVPEDNAWTSYIKMELRYREVAMKA